MNNLTTNTIAEIKVKPISELYVELFGEEDWDSLTEEHIYVRKAVNKIKRKRDQLNKRTKKSVSRRNEKNIEVSSLKKKISEIKSIRNKENEQVKKLKHERSTLQKAIKDIKQKIKDVGSNDKSLEKDLKKLIGDHNSKHEQVVLAVKDAQATHEEMINLGDLMTEKRKTGQLHHEEMKVIKKESDLYHHLFIRFLDHQLELEKYIQEEE